MENLDANFLNPFVDRLFGDYVELEYMEAIRTNKLPENISVSEFYFKAGAMKNVAHAQRNYISTNYTFVCRDLIDNGVNVGVGKHFSLESVSFFEIAAILVPEQGSKFLHGTLGENSESSELTTRGKESNVKSGNVDSFNTGNVPQSSYQSLRIIIDNEKRTFFHSVFFSPHL